MNHRAKTISFKNFRRFKDFPKLELGNITYMVGRNNSGKSTMVKAILLINDYLQNQLSDTFAFDNKVLEDANIVTFGRAKNNKSEEPLVSFEYQINEFHFEIVISGNENDTKAKVNLFSIKDSINGIRLIIDYLNDNITINKKVVEEGELDSKRSNVIQELEKAVAELRIEREKIKEEGSPEALKLQHALVTTSEKLKAAKRFFNKDIKKKGDGEYTLQYPVSFILEQNKDKIQSENFIKNLIDEFIWVNDIESKNKPKEKLSKNEQQNVLALSRNNKHLNDFSSRIINVLNQQDFHYIPANPTKQSALFYLRDTNNILSQAIHQFHQLGIEEGEEEWIFVEKWMSSESDKNGQALGFDIGDSFKINMRAGEAYEFSVFEKGVTKPESLSDKGMGSLQAMMLILKIASLIRLNKKHNKQLTILIEEPELNLHPALQSKLTDFFYEIHDKYGFNFILETHSEYMIRKSQVYTNENKYGESKSLNPNPFKVYYFSKDSNTQPYEIIYREDGKFKNDFDSGFFDVNTELAFKIL
ncbi:AAA family ATPase [Aquimarina rhabdastrellae]